MAKDLTAALVRDRPTSSKNYLQLNGNNHLKLFLYIAEFSVDNIGSILKGSGGVHDEVEVFQIDP